MINNLNQLNKKYWNTVPANQTISTNILPSNTILKKIPPKAQILDIGCGDGQLSEWFAKKGFSVHAIDINKNAIKNCQQKQTKVNYILQDITQKTTFSNYIFDLICFKFTLVNIHKQGWAFLQKEIDRISSSKGLIWIVEPLVSEDYKERYKLCEKFFKEKYTIFVFKNPEATKQIDNIQKLKTAIQKNEISRIVKHYTKKELLALFPNFKIISNKTIQIKSPSGFKMNTFIALLEKNE